LPERPPARKSPEGPAPRSNPEDAPGPRRVDWMTKPDNPFFAKALANRLWGHLLGRGLFHEVDDLRDTNPPSNPELLDALAKDFVAHKFDVKHVIRTIATSRVYQLSAVPTDGNKDDRQNFARYYARRLPAEVFLDAVNQATWSKAGLNGVGVNGRAVDLPHEGFGSYFLDTFDRPKRVTVCECERSTGATLSQVLLLANSEEMETKIGAGDGRVAKLMKDKKPPVEAIEELYLASLSRLPTDAEKNKTLGYLVHQANKQQGLEDVLWALLNSKEFMFNH